MKYIVGMMIALSLGATIWFMTHLSQTPDISKTNSQPVISRQDILNATDLKAGIKQAVQNNNNDAIDVWLEKASDLAVEAGLDHEDIQYLQSELAAKFVVFRAKRSLFNDAIEQAYYAIEDITVIKEQYPEAQRFVC
ncbi:hypothetical protein RS130_16790 [Paraglaciecola aquimarina]|uniref:Uncharacterized protein n=1 Tax=Paraglaciecola aquimarina TaxID=1235557 RepID=A0ABU3SZA7_9ALTE|nr:hypothetical protein [Paraglaciecola aquimarina]MDU0355342.1 hypothetical protein [Paraglaciecola aquimarina]